MNRITRSKVRIVFGLVGLLTLNAVSARADIALTSELSDGAKISDVAKIVAKAESADGVDKVEFRVDDELRHTDSSTPYLYEWDTILDKEGAHSVTITAYDSSGSSKRITLSLMVDNELSLGAEALANRGSEALREKNYAEATKFSRRSLKAEPNNISASRVIASVLAAQRNWSKAISALEGAKGLDTSAPAMRELAGYRIQQALLPDNAANFFGELVAADELRRKAANITTQETIKQNTPPDGKTTTKQNEAIGDALIEAGKFRQAVETYSKSAIGPDAPLSSVNRLALAYTLDARPQEAIALLRPQVRAKTDDAVTRAVLGLAQLRSRQFAEARATVQPDIASPIPATLIVAAYADAALGKRREASAMAKDAVGLLPNSGDAQFAYALAATDLKESDQAIQRALALSPFQSGPYLDYASRVAISKRQDRIDQALNLTDFVLKYEPEHFNAKMMQALLYLSNKRFSEAEPLLTWLQRKEKSAPDVLLTLATYWDIKEQGATVSQLLAAAKQADIRFERGGPEAPLEFLTTLNRKYYYRSGFFLLPSTLYPNQG